MSNYDYTPAAPESPSWSLHLPLFLLALTIAIFLGAQIGAAKKGGEVMRWQLSQLDKQLDNTKAAKKQLTELVEKRGDLVKQAGQVQAQYTSLLNDVLELSKSDDDAKKVVEKWNIQRNQPPAGDKEKTGGDAAAGSKEAKPAGQ